MKQALSAEQLRTRADIAYRNAEKAGVVVSPESLKAKTPKFESVLKEEGYDAGLHPQLSAVLNRLQIEVETPKTLKEIELFEKTLQKK